MLSVARGRRAGVHLGGGRDRDAPREPGRAARWRTSAHTRPSAARPRSCAGSPRSAPTSSRMVSHELRAPMASVIGCAQTLNRRWRELTQAQREAFLGSDRERDLAARRSRRRRPRHVAHRGGHVPVLRSTRSTSRSWSARPPPSSPWARTRSRVTTRRAPSAAARPAATASGCASCSWNLLTNAVKYTVTGRRVEVARRGRGRRRRRERRATTGRGSRAESAARSSSSSSAASARTGSRSRSPASASTSPARSPRRTAERSTSSRMPAPGRRSRYGSRWRRRDLRLAGDERRSRPHLLAGPGGDDPGGRARGPLPP